MVYQSINMQVLKKNEIYSPNTDGYFLTKKSLEEIQDMFINSEPANFEEDDYNAGYRDGIYDVLEHLDYYPLNK